MLQFSRNIIILFFLSLSSTIFGQEKTLKKGKEQYDR